MARRPFALLLLAAFGCGRPQHASCVEGEAHSIRITIEGTEAPFYREAAINTDPTGHPTVTFDALMDYSQTPPHSHESSAGPLRYQLCDFGLLVHYPERGTGAEEAPKASPFTAFVPLSKIASFWTN